MKKKIVDLQFPVGGLNKRYAYQSQPPYTTPDCLNVRPFETIEGRARGGSRPGLGKAMYEQLGSGNPIRLLTGVSTIQNDVLSYWMDNFRGSSLGSEWAVAGWGGLVIPTVLPNDFADVTYGIDSGAVRTALTEMSTASPYVLEIFISPYLGENWGTYKIFGRMDNTTPVATTDGISAELTLTGTTGAYSGVLNVYVAGVLTAYTFTSGTSSVPKSGWFQVVVDADNVKCYWLGTLVLNQNITTQTGKRMGFGMNCTVASGICLIDSFRAQYRTATNKQVLRKYVVASSNGTLYKEGNYNALAAVSTSLTLASDRLLHAAESEQKLYIADNGNPRVIGTAGTTNGAGTLLDDAAVTDWTALGIDADDDVVVILSGVGATAQTYKISSVHATNGITLTTSAGASASAIAYRVERAPKVYDPVAGTLAIMTATAGQVPTGCPLIALYRNALIMGGAPVAPHAWYKSRVGSFLDWDYSVADTDQGRAVAGINTDNGEIGEPLTAIVAHSDDYLIFGCENSLWIMRGDPALQGQIDNLSKTTGIVSRGAWCRTPSGEIIFLSRDGLYSIGSGESAYPQSISRERLPRELRDLDQNIYTITMAYDARDRGIHILLTPNSANGQIHYWFDMTNKGFWPFTLQTTHDPLSIYEWTAPAADDSAVLFGCRDGYVRRFRDSNDTDDGSTISSYVMYGPIKLGGNGIQEGLLVEMNGVAASNTGDITWSVQVGESPEQAVDASAFTSGTWTDNANRKVRPRARGQACIFKLASGETRAWAIDSIAAVIEQRGKQRL